MLLSKPCAFFKVDSGFLKLTGLKSATFFHSSSTTDLISSESVPFCVDHMSETLRSFEIMKHYDFPVVIIAYYELSKVFVENKVPKDTPLCLVLEFEQSESVQRPIVKKKDYKLTPLKPLSLTAYQEMFSQVRQLLLDGDCYQLNLTHRFDYSLDGDVDSLAAHFLASDNLSEYAHLISLPQIDLLLLSNSPESLFSIKDKVLSSRPIKGTMSDKLGQQALAASDKDDCELSIITDLIRNDLSSISKYFSRVRCAKSFFNVPGLVHQFSQVEVDLVEDANLFDVLKGVFPGGSITGAPKKRVVQLIEKIEKNERALYTGSTILLSGLRKEASINIRTATVSPLKKTLSYGAGGGITYKSQVDDEFSEMISKLDSFFSNII